MAEIMVYEYYKKQNTKIIDVRNNKHYQKIDVDFIIEGQKVEVKLGNNIHKYNDLVVELVSNADKDRYRKGWFYTSQADVFIWYNPTNRKMYQVLSATLKQFYEENIERIETKSVYFNEFGDFMKESVIAFIPIAELKKYKGYREITIE